MNASCWKVVLYTLSVLIIGFQLGISTSHQMSFMSDPIITISPTKHDGRLIFLNKTTTSTVHTRAIEESSYKLAYEESLGFFDDIDEREWTMLKDKVHRISPNTNGNPYRGKKQPAFWFQNHYEPDFTCRHERRIGRLGDGGKWVCDPHRLMMDSERKSDCLVYSVGSNGDSSFEAAVKADIGQHCEIHVFDMKNYTDQVEPTGSIFHQWGLSNKNGQGKHEYKTLKETVKELGHEGRTIDIFKIDCETCEWTTYQSWLDANVTLRQVLVEVHETRTGVPVPAAPDFFRAMYLHGYVIFHKEPNIEFWVFLRCLEYGFILMDKKFYLDKKNGTSILLPVGDQES